MIVIFFRKGIVNSFNTYTYLFNTVKIVLVLLLLDKGCPT